MACAPKNLTEDQVRAKALHNEFFGKITSESTPLEKRAALIKMRQHFKIIEVEGKFLNKITKKRLQVQEGEVVERYAGAVADFIISGRISDPNAEAFIRARGGKQETDAMNALSDSILAAETGTKIHSVVQSIIEQLVSAEKSELVHKNTEEGYGATLMSDSEMMNLLGINARRLGNLKKGVKEIFETIKETQKIIDPMGKVSILTEQFIADFNKDIGGTMDLFVMYSDGSVALFDYKSKNPPSTKVEWDATAREYKLIDEDWVPTYMYEALGRQLGATKDMLTSNLKVNKFRQIRGVPIHVRFKIKDKKLLKEGEIYLNEIVTLTMGYSQDALLEQIPITETLGNKELDMAVSKLEKVLHNYEIELQKGRLSPERREKLKTIVGRKRTALGKFTIRQDFRNVYEDFENLVKIYHSEVGIGLDINNKESKDYLNSKRLNEIIDEFSAYKSLLESSSNFFAELNMEGVPLGDYMENIRELRGRVSEVLSDLKRIRFDRTINAEDIDALMNMQSIGFMDSHFMMGKEFNQKILKMLHEKLSESNTQKILAVQSLEQEVIGGIMALQEWAKRNGTSLRGAYDMLTGEYNLIGKYTKELSDTIAQLRNANNIEGLKKIYTLKPDAQKTYQERLQDYKEGVNPTPQQLKNWNKRNSIEGALLSKRHVRIYYDFDSSIDSSSVYINEKFRELLKPENKELLDFWNMWTSKMEMFRDLLEITDYEVLPNNFLPWIRASIQDLTAYGMLGKNEIKEIAHFWGNVTSDDTLFGEDPTSTISRQVDIETGVERLGVPQFYLNPIKNNKGRIDSRLKLRDLGASLLAFGEMAYNYHYLTTIVEPHVEAMRDAIAMYGQRYESDMGVQQTDKSGRLLNIKDKLTSVSKKFEDELKYHLYGKKILDENKKWAKRLLNLKQFHSDYSLAGAWITWIGNASQVFGNTFVESQTAHFFSFKDFAKATRVAMGLASKEETDMYKKIIYFMEPHADMIRLKMKDIKATTMQKIFDSDTNYWGFRVAEHGVENIVTYAMFHTYGLHNGKVVRLKDASTPKGTKSFRELSKIVDNNLIIEGFKDSADNSKINVDAYADFRDRTRGVAKMIKGGMDSESQYGAQMYVGGKMFMHYKGWLPGMVSQRLSGLRYNNQTKTMHMGWWRAFTELELTPTEEGLLNYTFTKLLPSLAKLAGAILTVPTRMVGLEYKYKTSESRARRMFDAYLKKNIYDADIQKMNFEDFIQYQQGRIRALATEIFIMLSLYMAIGMMRRDWDEDGLPDWKASWASRTMFRITNRARRELSFLVSYKDWKQTITRSPIPATGVIFDIMRVFENTSYQLGDYVWSREEADKKGKGWLKETPKMIPWYKGVRTLDMLNDEFKKFEI